MRSMQSAVATRSTGTGEPRLRPSVVAHRGLTQYHHMEPTTTTVSRRAGVDTSVAHCTSLRHVTSDWRQRRCSSLTPPLTSTTLPTQAEGDEEDTAAGAEASSKTNLLIQARLRAVGDGKWPLVNQMRWDDTAARDHELDARMRPQTERPPDDGTIHSDSLKHTVAHS